MKKFEYLSSGEAAAILGVTRATVVNWINDGRIKTVKTDGDHNRIPKKQLKKLFPEIFDLRGVEKDVGLPCWQYFQDKRSSAHKCETCLVYKAKVAYCFKLASKVGHKGINCHVTNDPRRCEYYRACLKKMMRKKNTKTS